MSEEWEYSTAICDDAHAAWLLAEAVRRYGVRLTRDDLGSLLVEDAEGRAHTDDVLRALSVREAAHGYPIDKGIPIPPAMRAGYEEG